MHTNLPDTVYFDNGNLIVNNYDASGYKYKSTYYTVLATILTPYDTVSNYNFANDSIDFYVTEYSGNLEDYYTREDTVRKVFNTEGYYQDSAYYYFYKDHLGSNRAVKNLTRDTVVQRTQYYASGLPIVSSSGQSLQNRKYNGKEFIEAYGLDEYDSYARYYYPAIMRTTTPDPLAEKYYDLSPYAWCGNNPVNFVDWRGRDYTAEVDSADNTITISATYYTPSNSEESAQQAVDFWNELSEKYEYIVDGTAYTILFNLNVVVADIEIHDTKQLGIWRYENGVINDNYNLYLVVPKLEDENKNGVTTAKSVIRVRDERKETETGAHEVGHTLFLDHCDYGIMTPSSSDENRGLYVTNSNIKHIITQALNGKEPYKIKTLYTNSNTIIKKNGKIRKK